jgi:hypothetical protein
LLATTFSVHTLLCRRRTSSPSRQDAMNDFAESLEADPYVHPASDKEEKVGRGTELLLAWIRAGRELTSGQLCAPARYTRRKPTPRAVTLAGSSLPVGEEWPNAAYSRWRTYESSSTHHVSPIPTRAVSAAPAPR